MTDIIAMNTFNLEEVPVYCHNIPKNGNIIVDLISSRINPNKFNMKELLDIMIDWGYTAITYKTDEGEQTLAEPSQLLSITSPHYIEFAPCTQ